jgi:hypothetical protein
MLSHDSSDSNDDSILKFESGLARKKPKTAPSHQAASVTPSSSRSMDRDASSLYGPRKSQGPISAKAAAGAAPVVNPYAKTPPASSVAVRNPYLQKCSSSPASSQASATSTPVNPYAKQAPSSTPGYVLSIAARASSTMNAVASSVAEEPISYPALLSNSKLYPDLRAKCIRRLISQTCQFKQDLSFLLVFLDQRLSKAAQRLTFMFP